MPMSPYLVADIPADGKPKVLSVENVTQRIVMQTGKDISNLIV